MMPEHSSAIFDEFHFAGASAVTVTRNGHHERSCSREIFKKKIIIRNLISKNSNSGLALTKLTVTHLLRCTDLLIMMKYASAKMPIKSCAGKRRTRLASVVIRSHYYD